MLGSAAGDSRATVPEYLRISTLSDEDRKIVLPPSSIGPGGRLRCSRGACALAQSATPAITSSVNKIRVALGTFGRTNSGLVRRAEGNCIGYLRTWLSRGCEGPCTWSLELK